MQKDSVKGSLHCHPVTEARRRGDHTTAQTAAFRLLLKGSGWPHTSSGPQRILLDCTGIVIARGSLTCRHPVNPQAMAPAAWTELSMILTMHRARVTCTQVQVMKASDFYH